MGGEPSGTLQTPHLAMCVCCGGSKNVFERGSQFVNFEFLEKMAQVVGTTGRAATGVVGSVRLWWPSRAEGLCGESAARAVAGRVEGGGPIVAGRSRNGR